VRRKQFINPRDGRTTVAQWADAWLPSIDVGPLSEKEYRLRLKNHVLPEWGKVAIGDLSPTAITTWEKKLRQRVSKNYADGIVSVFRTLMDDAVTEKLRGDNPVATRKSGRRGKYKPKPKDERVIATPRQVLLIARNALEMRGLNEYAIVLASAYTGLRIGELAGVHRDQLALKDSASGREAALRAAEPVRGRGVHGDRQQVRLGRGLVLPPVPRRAPAESCWTPGPMASGCSRRRRAAGCCAGGDWYSDTWQSDGVGQGPARDRARGEGQGRRATGAGRGRSDAARAAALSEGLAG
jgi:hypothetical protein